MSSALRPPEQYYIISIIIVTTHNTCIIYILELHVKECFNILEVCFTIVIFWGSVFEEFDGGVTSDFV